MSDLKNAIAGVLGWNIDEAASWPEKVREEHNTVIEAARRWDALTSAETQRKAVIALQRQFGHDLHPHHSQIAEAVLRAVSEDGE